jgi:hypothetical protein
VIAVRTGRGQADLLGDVARDAGAAAGEVDVLITGGQTGVVQQRRREQQLRVDGQPLERAEGGTEREGPVGVVEQRGTESALRLLDGGPGERRRRWNQQ